MERVFYFLSILPWLLLIIFYFLMRYYKNILVQRRLLNTMTHDVEKYISSKVQKEYNKVQAKYSNTPAKKNNLSIKKDFLSYDKYLWNITRFNEKNDLPICDIEDRKVAERKYGKDFYRQLRSFYYSRVPSEFNEFPISSSLIKGIEKINKKPRFEFKLFRFNYQLKRIYSLLTIDNTPDYDVVMFRKRNIVNTKSLKFVLRPFGDEVKVSKYEYVPWWIKVSLFWRENAGKGSSLRYFEFATPYAPLFHGSVDNIFGIVRSIYRKCKNNGTVVDSFVMANGHYDKRGEEILKLALKASENGRSLSESPEEMALRFIVDNYYSAVKPRSMEYNAEIVNSAVHVLRLYTEEYKNKYNLLYHFFLRNYTLLVSYENTLKVLRDAIFLLPATKDDLLLEFPDLVKKITS